MKTGHARTVLALSLALFGLSDAYAQSNPWVAQIKVSRGIVSIQRDGQKFPGIVGARLKMNDALVTEANGSAGVMFNDNSTLTLGADSEVQLQKFEYDSTSYMGAFDAYVKRGTVSVQAGNIAKQSPDAMRVRTPEAELRGQAKSYVVSVDGR